MGNSAVHNPSSSARMLSGMHGARLVNGRQLGQLESTSVEDFSTEDQFGFHSRMSSTRGTDLEFPLRQELPVWKTVWDSRPSWLRMMDCSGCAGDRTLLETIVNVATSMPFIAIGLQAPRTKPAARLYADSLVGVGVASTLYHVSRGEARKVFRFGDYAMIAFASLCLNSAIRGDRPKGLMLASALLIPIQPTLVTVLHTGMMQATFSQRVTNEPKLRGAHRLHQLSSVIGGVLFVADDVMPKTPYIHAAWHLAAALGVATCTKLLE
ncbi:unnamed protein product [Calypogeia fissa]